MAQAVINGKTFDSADVKIALFGIEEDMVKEISYTTKREHQVNHSLASDASSWSMGKVTHEGSITLYMPGVVRFQQAAADETGNADITLIKPFQVDVTYTNDYNDVVNDTVWCKFTSVGRTVNGEMGLAQQLELLVLDVKYLNN